MHKSIRGALLTFLLFGCASTATLDDGPQYPRNGEVIVLARLKVIVQTCNHCEYRKNPATGKLEVAHPELPPWSIGPVKYPGQVVLSTGGAMKRSIYLGRPTQEEGEVRIKLKRGDSVVALRLKRGTTYSLGRYSWGSVDFTNTYYFRDRIRFVTPDEGVVYVGDIIIDISSEGGAFTGGAGGSSTVYGGGKATIEDNEAQTVAELREQYPALFQKYRYQKLLARSEPLQ